MRNTLKHLTLLTRMKDDGLLPVLTGSYSFFTPLFIKENVFFARRKKT